MRKLISFKCPICHKALSLSLYLSLSGTNQYWSMSKYTSISTCYILEILNLSNPGHKLLPQTSADINPLIEILTFLPFMKHNYRVIIIILRLFFQVCNMAVYWMSVKYITLNKNLWDIFFAIFIIFPVWSFI